jgi:hypothetical protein
MDAMRSPRLILASLFVAAGLCAEDARLGPLKDLNGYFPFTPPKSAKDWRVQQEAIRRRILVSQGLWPMPTKTPLNAVVHGRMEFDDYVVEKVYFESAPGFYVTGNLYRPKQVKGKVPAVLFPHGHWKDARFLIQPAKYVREEIASGQERFEVGGQSRFQSMCVQLARMGCIAWHYDALSDSDSIQFSADVVHKFAKQRPEMNAVSGWGLYSPQAESNLQSIMGLQTLNSVRGVDFLLTLPEVDPDRIAITGSSGGGTQTMLLAAVDERVDLSFPVVMVSTAMQGGCSCENATLLRVGQGNIDIAGAFAPKPQGMNTANDWTKEMATKGFPELQQLYATLGRRHDVMLHRGEHFPHNYNAVTRSAFYGFLNKHFKLGQEAPVVERDYVPLPKEKLTVWDAQHPAPKAADPDFERGLLKWFKEDSENQLRAAAATPEGREKVLRPAVELIIGRGYGSAGAPVLSSPSAQWRDTHFHIKGVVTEPGRGEEVAIDWYQPVKPSGRAVVWVDDAGVAGLRKGNAPRPEVQKLIEAGVAVIGLNLHLQGGDPVKETRVVAGPREVPAYTFGYNSSLFAQRVHDVLSVVKMLKVDRSPDHPEVNSVDLMGVGQAGVVAAAARAVLGDVVGRTAVDTAGFRFSQLLSYRDPMFLPGGSKYLDVPGLLALCPQDRLWIAGESSRPEFVSAEATVSDAAPDSRAAAAVEWLLK